MAGRDVNITASNFQTPGGSVSVQQRTIDLTFSWVGNDNLPHSDTRTVTFPNFLANRTNAWLKAKLTQLMIDAARVEAGIDTEADQIGG